jgi:hypothetical protein
MGYARGVALQQDKGLAGIDRQKLMPVPHHHQLLDGKGIGDGGEMDHRLIGHQRGLIEQQQLARQRRPRSLKAGPDRAAHWPNGH